MLVTIRRASGGLVAPSKSLDILSFEINELPRLLRKRVTSRLAPDRLRKIAQAAPQPGTADQQQLAIEFKEDDDVTIYLVDESVCPSDVLDLIDDLATR